MFPRSPWVETVSKTCLKLGVAALMMGVGSEMAFAQVATVYADPGYLIQGHPAMGYISANATFSLTFATSGNRTIRSTFELINESGAEAYIDTPADTQFKITTVKVVSQHTFVANKALSITETVQLVPEERLDPSRTYRVRLASVEDITAFPTDLGVTLTQAAGHRYVHFYRGVGVVARMREDTYLYKKSRVQTASGNVAAFRVFPWVDFYRYDPGQPAAPASVELTCQMEDDLGNPVPLAQSVFGLSSILALEGSDAGVPFVSSLPWVSGLYLNLQPLVQLDSVNRTYSVEVDLKFTDDPGQSDIATANGSTTGPDQLLDFNGTLFFGTISTSFSNVSNSPAYGAIVSSKVTTSLTIPAANGRIVGQGNTYTFGDGTNLTVGLDALGRAHYTGAASLAVAGPAEDSGSKNNISFLRENMTLSAGGLTSGNLTVSLPGGVGFSTDPATNIYESSCTVGGISLQQDLSPLSSPVDLGVVDGYLHEESKPLIYRINGLSWSTGNGTLQASVTGISASHEGPADKLATRAGKMINPAAAIKASNDFVFHGVASVPGGSLQIATDADGNGAVSTAVNFGVSEFHPHFPYAVPTDAAQKITHTGGTLTLLNDVCAGGSRLTGVAAFLLQYDRSCSLQSDGSGCDAQSDFASATLVPDGGFLYFTPDAGLQTTGSLGAHQLKWGLDTIPNPDQYTHTVLTNFTDAGYLMAGSSLIGGIDATGSTNPDKAQWMAPGAILFSGENPNHAAVIRPDTAAYAETDATIADYPGLTFRVSPGVKQARSRLAGVVTPNYNLASRGQYYVRYAGVSGIHQAETFTESMSLYGYDTRLTSLQFSYLDNANRGSRTGGKVVLPPPSDFTILFSELMISCTGGLLSAEVDNPGPVDFEYWNKAPADLLSMRFETLNQCDSSAPACLVLGVRTQMELVPQKLTGEMGFRPTGQIATRTNAAAGAPPFDSRLKVPALALPGPGRMTYAFTPSQDAYFNDAAAAGAPASGSGYLNLFGTIDVPFFQDLKCHVQTYAKAKTDFPDLYVMAGGWTEAGTTGFSTAFFDPDNTGFTATSATYRAGAASGDAQYCAKATQDWLGINEAFRYNLKWNEGGMSFSSVTTDKDFFVFNLTHQARYLCPETAEITFGLTYDGLPQINFGALAASATDAAVGRTQNLVDAFADPADAESLLGGFAGGRDLLCPDLQAVLAPVVDGTLMGPVDDLLDALYALPASPGVDFADVSTLIADHTSAPGSGFQTAMGTAFGSGAGSVTSLVSQRIGGLRSALTSLTDNSDGLFQTAGVKSLIRSLVASDAPDYIGIMAGALGGAEFDELVNTPGLTEIRAALAATDARLADINSRITNGSTGLGDQLATPLDNSLQSISDGIEAATLNALERYKTGSTLDLREISKERLRETIRQAVLDNIAGSELSGTLQTQVREYLQDAFAAANDGFDNGLQQVNAALRDVVATHLASVDQSINGKVLGHMRDMIGSGRLTGYAHINGDSLTELRVDGKFRWKVPDDLDLEAYLLIRQLDSDNYGGCLEKGEVANEITIGAERVPLEWISPNLRADMGVKFTMFDGSPIGVGGYFDMVGGPLTFEAFQMTDINAALAFGAKDGDPLKAENYLAASTAISIGEYDLAGGLFFGRTCSLDPILLIDAEVGSVLGSPPFTGGYVFGEAHLPLNELLGIPSSCMLLLKYGVGAGVFVFAEGPTFGGKFVGEIGGEALCLLSISGRMSLVGLKQGLSLESPMRFKGTGTVKGKAGSCPFCVRFKKSVGVTFEVSAGEISSPSIDY